MKNKIAAFLTVASLVASPVYAGKFNLKDYKTVAVAPVLSASNTRGVFESELAASAAGLSVKGDNATKASKAASAGLTNSGFGFAGKAQSVDVALMIMSTTMGMMPVMMKVDPAKAKQNAAQIQALIPKVEDRLAPDVVKALNIAMTAVQADDFQTALKALLVAMATAADSIKKGNERAHGYVATGLYAGLATTWAAAGSQNTALAQIAPPLVALLEEDAAMGGADRAVADQLKIVAGELASSSPSLDKVVAAVGAMQNVKPD